MTYSLPWTTVLSNEYMPTVCLGPVHRPLLIQEIMKGPYKVSIWFRWPVSNVRWKLNYFLDVNLFEKCGYLITCPMIVQHFFWKVDISPSHGRILTIKSPGMPERHSLSFWSLTILFYKNDTISKAAIVTWLSMYS